MGQSEPMRILKRWRYVGVWGPDLMLCAGVVRVGGVPQSFWAVWDRERLVLRQRTRMRLGAGALPAGFLGGRGAGGEIDPPLGPGGGPGAAGARAGGGGGG